LSLVPFFSFPFSLSSPFRFSFLAPRVTCYSFSSFSFSRPFPCLYPTHPPTNSFAHSCIHPVSPPPVHPSTHPFAQPPMNPPIQNSPAIVPTMHPRLCWFESALTCTHLPLWPCR
jgi:hypothetical protein